MEPRVRHMAVGAFTLALLAAAVAILLWASADGVDGETVAYRVLFEDDASGLSAGVGVRYRGLPIGRVASVGFSRERPNAIEARIDVRADAPVDADTVAELASLGLTGETFIQLTGGGAGAAPIAAASDGGPPIIPARPGGLAALIADAPAVTASVQRVLGNLETLTGAGSQASVEAAMRDIAATAAAFRAVSAQADDSVAAAGAAANEIGALARDLRVLVRDLQGLIATVDGRMTDISDNAAATLASADAAANAITDAADETQALIAAVRPPATRFAETGLY
ncbi:MAG: MlaD family protein, partial [Pseudomonadota bacterium]